MNTYSVEIIRTFTQNEKIVEMASRNLRVYCSYIYLLDAAQCLLQGVIKALGLQEKAQSMSVLSYTVIGLPLSFAFGVTGLQIPMLGINIIPYGIDGLWYGLSFGFLALTISFSSLVYSSDWQEISEQIIIEIQRQVDEYSGDSSDNKKPDHIEINGSTDEDDKYLYHLDDKTPVKFVKASIRISSRRGSQLSNNSSKYMVEKCRAKKLKIRKRSSQFYRDKKRLHVEGEDDEEMGSNDIDTPLRKQQCRSREDAQVEKEP